MFVAFVAKIITTIFILFIHSNGKFSIGIILCIPHIRSHFFLISAENSYFKHINDLQHDDFWSDWRTFEWLPNISNFSSTYGIGSFENKWKLVQRFGELRL